MAQREQQESWVSRHRWPLGIAGIIATFFIADGILVFAALRDTAFGPEQDYYQRALRHDQVQAALQRAQAAGLQVRLQIGQAPLASMPRQVDLRIVDGQGQPVSGLNGTLTAIRPADVRLRNQSPLTSVPGHSGLYRLLLRVPVSGLWVFELDARKDGQEYRVVMREDVRI